MTRWSSKAALLWLLLVLAISLFAKSLALQSYTTITADMPDSPPSKTHYLGTDAIARDRFSRLVYGTRITVLFAPVAALLMTSVAGLVGGISGIGSRALDATVMFICELFLSLPWMFLLIAARAVLPLNADPYVSAAVTFFLIGLLGGPGAARVVRARAREWANSDQYLFARSLGISPLRAVLVHLPPILRPVLTAQFWIALPVCIIGEANLSLIGLGVVDPLPSWGALIRECERPDIASAPWLLAPVFLLVATLLSAQILLQRNRENI